MKIIKQATARVDYLDEAPRQIAIAVAQAYVRGLEYSHGENEHSYGSVNRITNRNQAFPCSVPYLQQVLLYL